MDALCFNKEMVENILRDAKSALDEATDEEMTRELRALIATCNATLAKTAKRVHGYPSGRLDSAHVGEVERAEEAFQKRYPGVLK